MEHSQVLTTEATRQSKYKLRARPWTNVAGDGIVSNLITIVREAKVRTAQGYQTKTCVLSLRKERRTEIGCRSFSRCMVLLSMNADTLFLPIQVLTSFTAPCVHESAFLTDLAAQDPNAMFCSPLLVNAMCAVGAVSTSIHPETLRCY